MTLNTALMLYLSITLGAVLVVWLVSHYRRRHLVFLPGEQALFMCEYCQNAYLADSAQALHRCPHCQLWNKHPKPKG